MDIYGFGGLAGLLFALVGVPAIALYASHRLSRRLESQVNYTLMEPPFQAERWLSFRHGWSQPCTPRVEVDDLEALIASTPALVIHCWAAWNAYDRWIDFSWNEILPRWKDRLIVRSLEVDQPEFAPWLERWNVRGVPGTVCFRDGEVVAVKGSFMTPDELDALLTELYADL
jgi:hypothetical protein